MNAECFKQQFLPYHEKLYRIAFRLLGNREDAEDMLQEAYLKLWNKREGLASISNTEAYAVGVLKNVCFDFLRSNPDYAKEEQLETLDDSAGESLTKLVELNVEASLVLWLLSLLPEQQR